MVPIFNSPDESTDKLLPNVSNGLFVRSSQSDAPLPTALNTPSLSTKRPLPILSNGLLSKESQSGISDEVINPLSLLRSLTFVGIALASARPVTVPVLPFTDCTGACADVM